MTERTPQRMARTLGPTSEKVEVPRANLGAARRAREEAERLKKEEAARKEKEALEAMAHKEKAKSAKLSLSKLKDSMSFNMADAMALISSNMATQRVADDSAFRRANAADPNWQNISRQPSFDLASPGGDRTAIARIDIPSNRLHNLHSTVTNQRIDERLLQAISTDLNEMFNSPVSEVGNEIPCPRISNQPAGRMVAMETALSVAASPSMRGSGRTYAFPQEMDSENVLPELMRRHTSYMNSADVQLHSVNINITPVTVQTQLDPRTRTREFNIDTPSTLVGAMGIGTPSEILMAAHNRLMGAERARVLRFVTTQRRGSNPSSCQYMTVGPNGRWVVDLAQGGIAGTMLVINRNINGIEFTTVYNDEEGRLRAMGAAIQFIWSR